MAPNTYPCLCRETNVAHSEEHWNPKCPYYPRPPMNKPSRLEAQLHNAFGKAFPNYAWTDAETAVDLLFADLLATRKERDAEPAHKFEAWMVRDLYAGTVTARMRYQIAAAIEDILKGGGE